MTDRSPSSHAPRRRLSGTLTAAAAAAMLLAAALPTAVLAAPSDVVVLTAGSATVNGSKDANYVAVGTFRQNGDLGIDPAATLFALYNDGDADCPGAGELFIFIKMSTPGVILRSFDDPSSLTFREDTNGSGGTDVALTFQQGPVYNAARTNAEFSVCYDTVDYPTGDGIGVSFLFSNTAAGGTEGRVALLEGAASTTAVGIRFATPGSGPPAPLSGTLDLPAAPIRVFDSRDGGLAGRLTANAFESVDVTGDALIPDDAIAVTGNVTVIGPTKGGYVSVLTSQDTTPDVSTVNFPAGVTRPNNFIMPLSDTGTLEVVYKAVAGARTHVAIDITGWFIEGTALAGYADVTPARIMDSRDGTGVGEAPFQSGVAQTFAAEGQGGVPSDVAVVAVVGNLTVVGATKAGFAAVTTESDDNPTTSTLNFKAGETVANGIVIATNPSDGSLSAAVVNGGGTADLFFDVTGYFTTGAEGMDFFPVAPGRQLDTRIGVGLESALVARNAQTLTVSPADPIPAGAAAVTGNLTVTRVSRGGFVSATPTEDNSPDTSTINFAQGDTRANGIVSPLGEGGLMSLIYVAGSSTTATTDVLFDATGYFAP